MEKRQEPTGGSDSTIKLWDATSGREIRTLIGHAALVTDLAYHPDGRCFVLASFDNTVKLWDLALGEERWTLTGHTLPLRSVAFSPDAGLLASCSSDHTIRLWPAPKS